MRLKQNLVGASRLSVTLSCLFWLVPASCSHAAPPRAAEAAAREKTSAATARLNTDGHALMPIVIGARASSRVKTAAATLADYLGRMSGAKFEVTTGDGKSGLAVGTAADFPALAANLKFDAEDATRREDYLLRSNASGVLLLGASDLAVQHAVWDFLYRLGYRQFFPGKNWEIVPRASTLQVAVDVKAHPDYYARRIWYSWAAGNWGYENAAHANWTARNRVASGIVLDTGHAYGKIYNARRAEFDAHPEYLCSREPVKFCISNPGLRQLVIDYALDYFQKNPDADSISMDPSDGGGWECEKCEDGKVFKSVSDRVVTLANEVAAAVNQKYKNKYVSIYAYNEHSPPPSIRVHPQVVVSIATAFISGGFTLDQLIDGWTKQGAALGIREYYSVNPWDNNLPGAARGGNLDYIQKTIPEFLGKGARFYSSESGDNWGPNGLGYYFASRVLWDKNEAARRDEIVADFLDKSFGAARAPMADWYRLIDGSRRVLVSDDLIGRMYRALDAARKLSDDAGVQSRLSDLVLYTRYVELFRDYSAASGAARQKAFEDLIRFSYRIRATHMVHSFAIYRDMDRRDQAVAIPADAMWDVPEGKNPWKSSEPFGADQVTTFVSEGIARRKLLDFQPVVFSSDLVPATPLRLKSAAPGSFNYGRGAHNFYTWVEKAPAAIPLNVTAGQVYTNKSSATLELYAEANALLEPVASATVAPDKQPHAIELATKFSGLHRIAMNDGRVGSTLDWTAGTPMVLESSLDAPADLKDRWNLYFYVPKGTPTVGGAGRGGGRMLDGDGKIVRTFEDKFDGYFNVPVAPGQDGKLWKFEFTNGSRQLMTVPPFLARSADEMLLPKEVVAADRAK